MYHHAYTYIAYTDILLCRLAERELRHVLDEDGRIRLGYFKVVVGAQGLPTWLGCELGLGLGLGLGL